MSRLKGLPITSEALCSNIERVAGDCTDGEWADGADWYSSAMTACETMSDATGVDLELVAAVVAALSPQTMWSVNLRAAELLLTTGEQLPATLGQNHRRALSVLDGTVRPEDWSAKIGRFWQNILGDWQPVTVDSWAWSIATGDLPVSLLSRRGAYATVEAAYQQVALAHNVPPAVLQATTWTRYRRLTYITRMNERMGRSS